MVDYMRPKRYIFAGWAVALSAVTAAAWAFPAIADKAASQRESAVWQARAEAFQGVDIANVHISGHADTLAEFHINGKIKNALMRDVVMTNDLMGVPAKTFDTAKFKAQEHRCLAEAVYYEARSESKSGQKAVAEVVQNRVNSKHYPNTICGVVYPRITTQQPSIHIGLTLCDLISKLVATNSTALNSASVLRLAPA